MLYIRCWLTLNKHILQVKNQKPVLTTEIVKLPSWSTSPSSAPGKSLVPLRKNSFNLRSVTGMTIASQLPTDHKIIIVAKHLPGDQDTFDYASPWAGACWVGVPDSSPRDQQLQLDAYVGLWRIASEHPDSGLRISEVTEVMEYGSPDAIWFKGRIPGFRFLTAGELPPAATWGMKYTSIIISPRHS